MRNYVVFMDQLNSWWLMNIINNMSSQNPCWLMILWGYITIREREICNSTGHVRSHLNLRCCCIRLGRGPFLVPWRKPKPATGLWGLVHGNSALRACCCCVGWWRSPLTWRLVWGSSPITPLPCSSYKIPFFTNQHKWTTRGFAHVLLYYWRMWGVHRCRLSRRTQIRVGSYWLNSNTGRAPQTIGKLVYY